MALFCPLGVLRYLNWTHDEWFPGAELSESDRRTLATIVVRARNRAAAEAGVPVEDLDINPETLRENRTTGQNPIYNWKHDDILETLPWYHTAMQAVNDFYDRELHVPKWTLQEERGA